MFLDTSSQNAQEMTLMQSILGLVIPNANDFIDIGVKDYQLLLSTARCMTDLTAAAAKMQSGDSDGALVDLRASLSNPTEIKCLVPALETIDQQANTQYANLFESQIPGSDAVNSIVNSAKVIYSQLLQEPIGMVSFTAMP